MTFVLNRALPFVIALMIGTGLGNIFGFHKPASRTHPRCGRMSVERLNDETVESTSSNNVTHAKILYQPSTHYTPEALKHRTHGVVRLKVIFGVDGTTTVWERFSTLPDGLTEDAERVARETRFSPATIDGIPFVDTEVIDYIYSLNDREKVTLR